MCEISKEEWKTYCSKCAFIGSSDAGLHACFNPKCGSILDGVSISEAWKLCQGQHFDKTRGFWEKVGFPRKSEE